jgi:serine/threonine protein kinase/tetratricopeptide (TPR) repeat protein
MDSAHRQRLRELFDAAMDLEAPERASFVAQMCEGDPDIRSSLESLLAHADETGSSFDRAMRVVADLGDSLPTRLDLVGRTLGQFRVVEKIGEGGMGMVFRATDTRLGRDVAIKILPDAFTRDPERLARFEREARVLASLNHPNIATLFGIEEFEGVRFLVLELVRGQSLASILARGPLPAESAARLAVQIADGLAKAHEAEIVHRDLKPDNLMMTDDGLLKILDFGLATAGLAPDDLKSEMATEAILKTEAGRVLGTTAYMSPEQVRGERLDHRSDQFAFGSVLYEMLTGVRAFSGLTAADTLVEILGSEPDPPEGYAARAPASLRSIIDRCLSKNPAGRYVSTRDLARDLRDAKKGLADQKQQADVGRPQPARRHRWRPWAAIAAVVVLAAAASVLWRSGDGQKEDPKQPFGDGASIAVLPLENLGSDDQEYFADGMTDALITHLSKIKSLKVISRTSVQRYKGSRLSLPEIARELGVDKVLTGSVLHAGGQVRISTQLIEAGTDRNLWAESYEKNIDDILALQGEVAWAIARAVEVEVDPEVEHRIASNRTIDPDAYELYLRGLAEVQKATSGLDWSEDTLHDAVTYFQRAIDLEPEWAEPYAGLGGVYFWLASAGGPDTQAEFYPRARDAASRAIELDPTVAKAHATLGHVKLVRDWDWAGAERSLRRAFALDPNESSWDYGRFLFKGGRYDEAIAMQTRARERSPASVLLARQLGAVYLCAGRPEEAERLATEIIDAHPESPDGYSLLASSLATTGRYDEAVATYEGLQGEDVATFNGLHGEDIAGSLQSASAYGRALAMSGRVDEARQILRGLEERGVDWMPWLYVALGEDEKAMQQIEAAFAVRRDVLLFMGCVPEENRLWENPRFREIYEAIGFPN